jgi:hypothetical protein
MEEHTLRSLREQGYETFVGEGLFRFPVWIREVAGEDSTWQVLNGPEDSPENVLSFRVIANGPASTLARPGWPSALATKRAVLAVVADRIANPPERLEVGREYGVVVSRADIEVRALQLPQS